jgi:hypothetical protein
MTGTHGYVRARECLRRDFANRCAYCCISEVDNGGENFEIDHFRPISRGGDANDYDNLYWSCHGCNGHKGDQWPTGDMLGSGIRFADPCSEPDYPLHFIEDDDGLLVPLTQCGDYHVDAIKLNRRSRLARRRRRNELLSRYQIALELASVLPQSQREILEVLIELSSQLTDLIPVMR